MYDINKLFDAFSKKCECRLNEPMSKHTTFRIGGNADIVLSPDNEIVISEIIKYCKAENIPLKIFGKGSNILVSDDGIRGAVIILDSRFSKLELVDETTVLCQAGAAMSVIGEFACEHSLTGFEFGAGIPGTVGGALYMNAGAYDGEMKDIVVSAKYLDSDGEAYTLPKEELKLGYRKSVFTGMTCCITEVVLDLKKGNKEEIRAKMSDLMHRRVSKQPLNFPSAGSTFKRPEGYFAGALIEQSGLKGYTIGGACVSEKHAGFVVNKGGATSKDVLKLVEHIKATVKANSGVELECEIKFI